MCKIDTNGQLFYVSPSSISMIELSVGTMGLEPMTSSARGWQSTKLTYVPVTYSLRVCIIFLETKSGPDGIWTHDLTHAKGVSYQSRRPAQFQSEQRFWSLLIFLFYTINV